MKNVNVVIMGKTGVGKSTLVNAVFKRKLAKTGVGAAITIKNEKYNQLVSYIKRKTNYATIIPVLCMDWETDVGIKKSYGIDDLVSEVLRE